MNKLHIKLKKITEEILFCEDNLGKQYQTCNELYNFFAELTGIYSSSEKEEDLTQTFLENGKAISPRNAALCVLDFARTTQFLRGIRAAIFKLKKRFPNERLEILYAGCGPFAALIVPLLTLFEPDDFRVTLIDIHEHSINAARKIFADLEAEDFVADFLQMDVNHYQHSGKLHLVICETMQTAMKKEPHAALTLHLAPQLAKNGIFIPQKIWVEGWLVNLAKEISFVGEEKEKERFFLGEIFRLEAEKMQSLDPDFPPITVEIPSADLVKLNFMYFTTVSIFDDFLLKERNSSITIPLPEPRLKDIKSGDRIEFRYHLGGNPDFEIKVFSNGDHL